MSQSQDIVIDLNKYLFHRDALSEISTNRWVKNQWPLVYIIKNDTKRIAYVGETTNAFNRIKNHFANEDRTILNTITLIGSDRFNKSATLDIESQLIQYLAAESTYTLQNGNGGLTHHNYYERPFYRDLFKEIWSRLAKEKLVTKSLEEIENSNLFKYSPYKSLSTDQRNSVMEIIEVLSARTSKSIFVEGSAGTGKTILATYLMKLLHSPLPAPDEIEDLEGYRLDEYRLLERFQQQFKDVSIGLVVPMTSLRKSLKEVFKHVGGLKPNMVISPSDVVKKHYDIIIVDEAHRLAQRKNIPNYGSFDATNRALGLGNEGTQLDWILMRSSHQIFFYDEAQSVKPSDLPKERFDALKRESLPPIKLTSQMRVSAGTDYINFVDNLLKCRPTKDIAIPEDYDLRFFSSFQELYDEIQKKEAEHGLSRMIAGYSWNWASKNDKRKFDIDIEGVKLQWNNTHIDWINSENAALQVGCIHTTQGYDLNYAGVIFGHEITYNEELNRIEVIRENYHDRNGKSGIKDDERLKKYIVNIYKTIMYRGIRGTFVYACDPAMKNYLQRIFAKLQSSLESPELEEVPASTWEAIPMGFEEVKPFENAVPLYQNLSAAAGEFSHAQDWGDLTWVSLPEGFAHKSDYFVCRVEGESMNKIIPTGSWCLFRKDPGGSRAGKTVLVQHRSIQDPDYESGFTVKKYASEKAQNDGHWSHRKITLSPMSFDSSFEPIVLEGDDLGELVVVGEFVGVVG